MMMRVAENRLRRIRLRCAAGPYAKGRIMVIDVRARGLSLSESLRHHVDACLAAATRPFGVAISRVTVRLTDVNGDRGGDDKKCRVVAVLPSRRLIVTEGLHADAYTSIEQAFGRMRRAVSHALARGRRRRREAARGLRRSSSGGLVIRLA
jgi:ribosome-associated translation inhibitor RaiA